MILQMVQEELTLQAVQVRNQSVKQRMQNSRKHSGCTYRKLKMILQMVQEELTLQVAQVRNQSV